MIDPFALNSGTYIADYAPPPPPRARAVGAPPVLPAGATYGSPAARAAMAAIAAARSTQPPPDTTQEPEPPSAPPPPAASPPTSGTIEPTVKPDTTLVPADDETAKLKETINTLFPQVRGPAPANPWAMAAMALPMLTGNPAATAAMTEGYMGGQVAREQYAQQVAEKRAGLMMPYFEATAAQRQSGRLAQARLDLQDRQAAFGQELQSAEFALKEFQWANPSAFQKMQVDVNRFRIQALQQYQLAHEAYWNGRLDLGQQHEAAYLELTQQARDSQRQAVGLAAQALAQGRPGDAVGLYKFVSGKATDLQSQMAWVAGTPQEKALQGDLDYYRQLEQQLRPRVQSMGGGQPGTQSGAPPQGGGFSAVGTGAERTYQTKYSGTIGASQVADMIAKNKTAGRTPAQIRAALMEDGIDPADFGY